MEKDCIVPEVLLVEILSRLPVRYLLPLRCVCKSWCALVDSGSFARKHYQVQYDICRANGGFLRHLHVYLLSKKQGDVISDLTLDLVHDSEASFTRVIMVFDFGHCVGVVNGIICFLWLHMGLGLWNPATREFKAIPCRLVKSYACVGLPSEILGFGFDKASNDFKIVAGNKSQKLIVVEKIFVLSEPTARYEVFSLSTNSWKRVRDSPLSVGTRQTAMDAYFNGSCYWTASDDRRKIPVILSFNFSTEVFDVFDLPEDAVVNMMADHFDSVWKIEVCMESLALIVNCVDLEKTVSSVDIWVVTKFYDDSGVPLLSRQHLFTSDRIPAFNGLWVEVNTLLMDGDLLVRVRSDDPNEEESRLYNPSTGTFKKLGTLFCSNSFIYVESLFPLSMRLVHDALRNIARIQSDVL